MSPWLQHVPALPIVIPLVTASVLVFVSEAHRVLRGTLAICSVLAQLGAATALLWMTSDGAAGIWPEGIGVYPVASWPAPYGIVLVVDQLAALMITLTVTLALAALVYSLARWDRADVYFLPLAQLLLAGLNGAFLTGDLFNLFVFVEMLLAASYGLVMHSGGLRRVTTGLHYIAVNLAGSLTFLIGVAVIYGVVGSLNMAEIGLRWTTLTPEDRVLFEGGAAILGIAFFLKAGAWPLNFWLTGTYWVAGAPVAAIFSVMTKVGVYAILRIGSLLQEPAPPAPFGGPWLFGLSIATILFGTAGMLGAHHLTRLIAYTVIVSSGTLLGAIGLGAASMTGPAVYYLLCSVPATAAFFLLTGMTERIRTIRPEPQPGYDRPPVSYEAFNVGTPPDPHSEEDEVGVAIPGAMAFLGLMFVGCVLMVTGMPPLAGFLAKLLLLQAAVATADPNAWLLMAAILLSGFGGLIALARMGVRLFWTVSARATPRLRLIEAGPVAFLMLVSVGLTIWAGPAAGLAESAARLLADPSTYIGAVLGAAEAPR